MDLRQHGQEGAWDVMEGNDLVDGAGLDGFLRHPEDDTRRFILCHRHGTGLFHGQEALCSISPHAGQDDTEGV